LTNEERVGEIFGSLKAAGLAAGEVYLKNGRSRRFEVGSQGRVGGYSQEQGWAIRAGSSRASLFVAGTGLPSAGLGWPAPDGQSLSLPAAVPIPPWQPPTDLDSSLVAESEAIALLEGIERALVGELAGSRLVRGLLEEGSSETSIYNTLGVKVDYRSRAASLFVDAVGPWKGSASVSLALAERVHRRLKPVVVAKRLANRLLLSRKGMTPDRERGEILVGAAVSARVLASLQPLLLGGAGEQWAARLRDRHGRIGSKHLTVVDDGRLEGGVLEAPVDGEGLPTGRVCLIEEGRFRQSLTDWRKSRGQIQSATGWMRRESWRDLPRVAPSHLFIEPDTGVTVGDLLSSIARGFYLLEPLGVGRFDFEQDRFQLPVCGFALRQGAATAPLSRAWLEGSIGAFLHRVQAVARDLTFQPLGAMIGAPTLLVSGFGLRGED